MKRGLVLLDPAEIPEAQWRDRVAALQERMRAEGVDVALIYGDVSRSDDIAYLTNLCIYWNEGMLAVPADGEPVFLTKLSPRVHPWMRRVSTITDVRSGKSFGTLVAGYLEPPDGVTVGTVGLVDARLWPSAVLEEVTGEVASAPGRQVKHLGSVVREQRLIPSAEELALLGRAAGILAAAAREAARPGLHAPERAAILERELRGAGFLDVQARISGAADGVSSLQVTGQYRTAWVHVSRLVPGGPAEPEAGWSAAMREALTAAIGAAEGGATAAHLTTVAEPALTALPATAWHGVRWVNQADMATGGEYADYPPDLAMTAGSVVVITVETVFADGRTASVADTVLVDKDGAESLTGKAGR